MHETRANTWQKEMDFVESFWEKVPVSYGRVVSSGWRGCMGERDPDSMQSFCLVSPF